MLSMQMAKNRLLPSRLF